MRGLLLLLLWGTAGLWAQQDSGAAAADWRRFFPEPHRFEFSLKGGYSKDNLDSASFPMYAAGAEYRTSAVEFDGMGGGYALLQVPLKLYYFPTRAVDAVLFEAKIRPELGPPFAVWLPHGFVDLGYAYANNDWLAKRSAHSLQALMLGGWFRLPLLDPRRGAFMVSGATSVQGDELVRFSCYLDWMVGKSWGLTLHGDNFKRTWQGESYHYGSFNAGVLWRL